ncbi:gamma-carotene 1'-hydroxylase CruF [Lyngbya aestuarii]|uniref:gamma-carotene 1'-hydroxylase CruF n=1 Tax=Lyngbya aestuarii TaxID=118322 RepID=UPI00403E0F3C
MKQLVNLERFLLTAHIFTMVFGLAGLVLVLPNPELITGLPEFGQTLFRWSMAGGGVVYIILGAIAVAIYAYRHLGLWRWLTFMVPAVVLSLSSELLGTSTGFPFGEYGYLSGLGYKIAGLVPFTIPLSWFYMGFASYVIARTALEASTKGVSKLGWLGHIGAIVLGATLLTSWDFALDPAMSRTIYPFWQYGQEGAFFGTPYQNFAGWMATGALFMTVAALCWGKNPLPLSRQQLVFPLSVYITNVVFGAVISITGAGIWIPVVLSLLLGVAPAICLWWLAPSQATPTVSAQPENTPANEPQISKLPASPVGATHK